MAAGWVVGAAGVELFEEGDEVGEADVVGIGGVLDLEMQVRAGGGGREELQVRRVETQGLDDIGPDFCGGGRREADDWRLRECFSEVGELQEAGAELVAPFRYTMGLVHGNA